MSDTVQILHVLGPRIKIKVTKPEEKRSGGGIILHNDITASEDQETGIVVQCSEYAYANFSTPWVVEGDRVLFNRYSGKPIEETGPDGKVGYYRILRDIDVLAVMKDVPVDVQTEDKT